jgi:acetyl-CoA C-acetyltransferase
VRLLGHAETVRHTDGGRIELTSTGAEVTGPKAFAEAGVTPDDIDYAGIYDSFTITLLANLEDLGFCERGGASALIRDGGLVGPHGRLPTNTDGGGLCNNHPGNRGGLTKIIEAVRRCRTAGSLPFTELAARWD